MWRRFAGGIVVVGLTPVFLLIAQKVDDTTANLSLPVTNVHFEFPAKDMAGVASQRAGVSEVEAFRARARRARENGEKDAEVLAEFAAAANGHLDALSQGASFSAERAAM